MKILSAFLLTIMLALSGCDNSESSVSSVDLETSKFLKVSFSEDKAEDTLIATNQYVVVSFSSNINVATVEAASVYIRDESGHSLAAKLAIDQNRISIIPHDYFLPSKQYTIVVTMAVEDINGRSLEGVFTYPFMTSSAPDTLAPSLVSLNPADGASVDKSTYISMEFDETIADNGVKLKVSNTDTSASISGSLIVNGNILLFVPDSDLTPSSNYTVTLQGTVEDVAGNGYSGTSSWTFSVNVDPDSTAPSLVSLAPADGASVDQSTYVSMEFDEKIADNGVELQLEDAGTFAIITGTTTVTEDILLFVSDSDLNPGSNYNVTLQGTVEDIAGNTYSGISNWSFSVNVIPDVTAPSLVSLTPASGASADKTTDILITFDEAMTNTGALLELKNNDTNANVQGTGTLNNNMIRFLPDSDLIPGNNYTVTVLGPLEDLAGNTYTGIRSWSFFVDPVDNLTVKTVFNIGKVVIIYFSEKLDPATISEDDFSINGGSIGFGSFYFSGNKLVSFRADSDISDGDTVTVSGTIKDSNGNSHNNGVEDTYTIQ